MTLLSKASTLAMAAATAAMLSASTSVAMGADVAQLEDSVKNELVAMNIDTSNLRNATLAQLAEISSIVDSDSHAKRAQIDYILGNDGPHLANMQVLDDANGRSQLERGLRNDLTRIGVTLDHPETLPLTKLVALASLFNDEDGHDRHPSKERVMEILNR